MQFGLVYGQIFTTQRDRTCDDTVMRTCSYSCPVMFEITSCSSGIELAVG